MRIHPVPWQRLLLTLARCVQRFVYLTLSPAFVCAYAITNRAATEQPPHHHHHQPDQPDQPWAPLIVCQTDCCAVPCCEVPAVPTVPISGPKLTLRTYRSLKFRSALLMLLVDFSFAFQNSCCPCHCSCHCSSSLGLPHPVGAGSTGSIGLDFISGDAGGKEHCQNCTHSQRQHRTQWQRSKRPNQTHTHTRSLVFMYLSYVRHFVFGSSGCCIRFEW